MPKVKYKAKMKNILVIILLLIFINQAQATITDVNIVPQVPTATDIITIITYGIESRLSNIDNVMFSQNTSSLQLAIYVSCGISPAVDYWEHPEIIGTLPSGIYQLEVQEYKWDDKSLPKNYVFVNAHQLTFEVVPEPATILLLGLGFLKILRRELKPLEK